MKTCRTCKKIKPLSEFYKNAGHKDGHLNSCKACCSKYQKKYNQSEKRKANQKRYRKTEKGKLANLRGVKKYKKTAKGKATQKRFLVGHPNYVKARQAVNNAIRAGKLPRPDTLLCHYCPKPAEQYHHWHGYEPENYLDVIPICEECHMCKQINKSLGSFPEL